jgi:protein-tyrosine phosphatase
MIIDMHSHILPGVDDGSRSTEESAQMMRQELEHGVRKMVATPHFYAQKDSVNAFLERRSRSRQRLMEAIQGEPFSQIELRSGAEVYYFDGIGHASMLPKLCIEGTDSILLEMPFCQWTMQMYEELVEILEDQHIDVILAHIERYYEYQKDKSVWEEIFSLPVTPQINAESFLKWKYRRKCFGFLGEGYEAVLGSDCHNMTSRQPNLAQAREAVRKKAGQTVLDEMDRRAERLLG